MSVFLLINNSSTVKDVTPAKLFFNKETAIKALYEYEMKSVFKPIVLYEYRMENDIAEIPSFLYRIKRTSKNLVEGHEQIPVRVNEFIKNHPFIFDKLESFRDAEHIDRRAV